MTMLRQFAELSLERGPDETTISQPSIVCWRKTAFFKAS
jgi:hypothetical protein